MKIGIDIDDTTVVTINSMIKYGKKYSEEVLKTGPIIPNLGTIKDRFYLNALFGWSEETKFDFFTNKNAVIFILRLYSKVMY